MENNEEPGLTPERESELEGILSESADSVLVQTDTFAGQAISYYEFPADLVIRVGLLPLPMALMMSKQMLEVAMLTPAGAAEVASMSYLDLVKAVETWVEVSQLQGMKRLGKDQPVEDAQHESMERLRQILEDFNRDSTSDPDEDGNLGGYGF